MSRYALTIKQTTKNDFRKRTTYIKINLNDQASFWKFLQISVCGDKTWNDWNNYFILQIDIQLQWNAEYLKFLKSKKHGQKIIFLIF